MTHLRKMEIQSDVNGTPTDVSIQYPLPVDGDSVYEKDIDVGISSSGTFTGNIVDLFNSYQDVDILVDSSSTNPKTFTIKFHRPITSNEIGFGSSAGDFSNVKIELKDIAGTVRKTVDDSANDTKYTSNLYPFTKTKFIQIEVSFTTADPVSLNGSAIPKIESTTVSAIDGYISETNTSQIPLGISGVFTGTQVDTLNYGMVLVTTYSDVASATDGLSIQFRSTPTSPWRESDSYTVAAGAEKTFSVQTVRRFMRVVYTNGLIGQTEFDLQTILKPVYVKPSSHRVADTISGQDDAELVKANLTAQSLLTGLFENISSYRETLNVNNSWVHRKIVNESFHQHTGITTTPSIAITSGDVEIEFTSVVGFAIGGEIKLTEGDLQEVGIITITNIVANTVTLDRPVGNDYTTAAIIADVITNMAVSGTLAAPEIFEIDPPEGVVWQFTRILPTLTDGTAMDDGLFGGIPALTNGVVLRATTTANRTVIVSNWKTNGDIRADMYNFDYYSKAPAGVFGAGGRWTFTSLEFIAEISGDASPIQKFEVLIQDDLTGLLTFKQKGQGRVFSP